MKRKFKVLCHQVEQLTEEAREKDSILKKDGNENDRMIKDTEH
jgi:hypothetical protein